MQHACFPICQHPPKTQRSAIHTHSALATAPSASPGSLQDALKRMTVERKCTHMPHDPPPRLSYTHFLASTGRQRSPCIIIVRCCFNLLGASLVLSYNWCILCIPGRLLNMFAVVQCDNWGWVCFWNLSILAPICYPSFSTGTETILILQGFSWLKMGLWGWLSIAVGTIGFRAISTIRAGQYRRNI